MFIAHVDNLLPSFWEDSLNFSGVELISFSPWFMCEVPQYDEDSSEAVCKSTYLIGDIINLHHFAKLHEIEKTYLITPAHMTESENWSIKRLKSISKAIYKIEDYENLVYRFETVTGEFLDNDKGGFAQDMDSLQFETLLKFS